jgi:hypothetical protein
MARAGGALGEHARRGTRGDDDAAGESAGTRHVDQHAECRAGGGGAAEPELRELARDALGGGRSRIDPGGALYGRDRGDPFQSGDLGERPTPVCGGPGQAKTVALTACMRTLLIILNALRKHRTRWDYTTSHAGAVRDGRRHPPGEDPTMDGLAIVDPTPNL